MLTLLYMCTDLPARARARAVTALALAAPSVEVAARGGGGATNAFASSCQQANGVAYCCNTVQPGSDFGNVIPITANEAAAYLPRSESLFGTAISF
jgi:hypothetical protein